MEKVYNWGLNHEEGCDNIYLQMFWQKALDFGATKRVNIEYTITPEILKNVDSFLKSKIGWNIDLYRIPYNVQGVDPTEFPSLRFEIVLSNILQKSVIKINGRTNLEIDVASSTVVQATALAKEIELAFPKKIQAPKPQALEINFWYFKSEPRSVIRTIAVPNWSEVKHNYTPKVRIEVEKLIKINQPTNEAKLVILNGVPGCGKSYLLRTLLWEWRKWAKGDFVLDPEVLFSNPSYLLNLLLDKEDDGDYLIRHLSNSNHDKWRILILEDADSYISTTAKSEYGQQVSRLLNLLDGLVGQGIKIMVIITANEENHKIHDAIKRPGRCLSNIWFDGFNKEEAIKWLKERNLDETFLPSSDKNAVGFRKDIANKETYTLATLYQVVKEENDRKETESMVLDGDTIPE